MKCPQCSSTNIRKNAESDHKLAIMFRPFVTAIRCYVCGRVFYRPTAITDDVPSEPSYRTYRRAA